MVVIRRAAGEDIEGISRVCREGCMDTYKGIRTLENISRNNKRFYNYDRISKELKEGDGWDGYIVAVDEQGVIGAIGGGMTGSHQSEVFVFYMDPKRRGEGIGTRLLRYLTEIQREKGSREQWVSVQKGNLKGIPFYEKAGFKRVSERAAYSNSDDESYVSIRYSRIIG